MLWTRGRSFILVFSVARGHVRADLRGHLSVPRRAPVPGVAAGRGSLRRLRARTRSRSSCCRSACRGRRFLEALFEQHKVMKAVSPSQAEQLARMGYRVWEDRDNFDYLYPAGQDGGPLRPQAPQEEEPRQPVPPQQLVRRQASAGGVRGRRPADPGASGGGGRRRPGDYAAAREALEKMEYLQLCGGIFYVNDEPVAYTLGEELAQGRVFVIHFEKAIRGRAAPGDLSVREPGLRVGPAREVRADQSRAGPGRSRPAPGEGKLQAHRDSSPSTVQPQKDRQSG